ncbi:MAG: autotransporter-associated beta strand repeat-containing protein [Verrucomicrobiota bacterium]
MKTMLPMLPRPAAAGRGVSSFCARSSFSLGLAALATLVAVIGVNSTAQAQTNLYWDQNGGSSGTGGTGTWNLSSSLWRNGSTGGALQAWSNTDPDDNAIFQGTVGTVTINAVGGTVHANSLVFSTNNYVVAAAASNSLTLTGSALLTVNNTATISAPILGTVGMTKGGTATLTLTGANTYSGTTTISAGTLQIGSSGGSSGTLGTGSVTNNGNLTFSRDTLSVSNVISGTGNVTVAAGITTLTGANSYTGTTNVTGGTLKLGADERISNSSALTVSSGAFFDLDNYNETLGSIAGAGTIRLSGANNRTLTVGGTNASTTFSGAIEDTGTGNLTLTKTGTGVLTLSGSNTYVGPTNINNGTLRLGNNDRLADTTAVTVASGAVFDLVNYSETVGSIAGAGTIRLTGGSNRILTVGGDGTSTTFSGILEETGAGKLSLVKGGNGTLILSGTNTHDGSLTINAGTVQIGAGGTTGSIGNNATATIALNAANSVLAFNRTDAALSIANPTSGLGGVSQIGSGTTTLTGILGHSNTTISAGTLVLGGTSTNTIYGTTTISGGTLEIAKTGGDNRGLGSSNVTISGSGLLKFSGGRNETMGNLTGTGGTIDNTNAAAITLTLNQAANTEFAGVIQDSNGAISLIKNSAGTLTLSGANTYAGTLTINGGAIQVGNGGTTGQLGAGAVTINGGTNLTFNRSDSISVANTLSGTGTLVQAGAGTTTLIGTNGLTGTTTISAGTLQIGNGGTTGSLSTGALTNNGALIFNRSDSINVASAMSGTGSLTKLGAGTLTLSGTGVNSTSGAFNVNVGNVEITKSVANAGIGDLAAVTVASGSVLRLNNGQNETIGSLAGAGTVDNINGTGMTLTTGGNGGTTIFSGVIQDTGGTLNLVKEGAGTMTLSGANAYAGTTTVNGGVLSMGNGGTTGTIGAGAVSVGASGQLWFYRSNTASIANAISGTGSIYQAGSGTTSLTSASNTFAGSWLVGAGNLTVNAGSSLGNTGGSSVEMFSGATLNLNNTSQTLAGLTGSGGTINLAASHALTINSASTGNFGGSLSTGAGSSITKSGVGSLTLRDISLNGSLAINNNGSSTLNLGDSTLKPVWGPSGHTAPPGEAGYITLGSGNTLTFGGTGDILVVDRIRDFAGQETRTIFPAVANSTVPTTQPETTQKGHVVVDMASTTATVRMNALANSYTGNTTVNQGVLILDTRTNGTIAPHDPVTASFHAINGNLTIGKADGTSTGATVRLGVSASPNTASEAISMLVPVTINRGGTLELNGNQQTLGPLTLTGGGDINLAALTPSAHKSTLYLSSDVNVTGHASDTANISGSSDYLSLTLHRAAGYDTFDPDSTRTFTVSSGGGSISDFSIGAIVQNGAIVKLGTGVMTLSNSANEYDLSTTVANGTLRVTAGTIVNPNSPANGFNSPLGSSPLAASPTRENATFVTYNTGSGLNGTLQLDGNGIAITKELLVLSGNGYNGLGALSNINGNNSWGTAGAGWINLDDNARINSNTAGNTLTLNTNITSQDAGAVALNKTVTFGGVGNTTVNGSINTGNASAQVIKDGTGTLTLTAGSGYQGKTDIQAGTVVIQHGDALGAISTGANGTYVANGAALNLENNISVGGESLQITGTGTAGAGALRSTSGANTFNGQTTVVSNAGNATRITANSGASLTMGNATTGLGITSTAGNTQTLTFGHSTYNGNVTVNGSLSMGATTATAVNISKEGTGVLTLGLTAAATSNSVVGNVTLSAGKIQVTGTGGAKLSTRDFDTAAGTTLVIASGGTVTANLTAGVTATFNGGIAADLAGGTTGGGTFEKTGAGTLAFNYSFNAGTTSKLIVDGGTLALGAGVHVQFGTIELKGSVTLDFGGTADTWLKSTNLIIDPSAVITVVNWIGSGGEAARSTWYATNTVTGVGTLPGADVFGGPVMNQITFANHPGYNYTGMTTTWVSGNHDGWLNREIRPTFPTPEPSTYGAIFFSGCLGFLAWRRWRWNKAKAQAPLAA